MEEVDRQIQVRLDQGLPLALAWYFRGVWGSGKVHTMIGSDIWELEGYQKKSLKDLIEDEGLVAYRDTSPALAAALEKTFY